MAPFHESESYIGLVIQVFLCAYGKFNHIYYILYSILTSSFIIGDAAIVPFNWLEVASSKPLPFVAGIIGSLDAYEIGNY